MTDQLLPQQSKSCQLICVYLLAGLVTSLGFIVLCGWYLENTTLIQVHPSFVPMQYNTALGFLLAGCSLFATLRNQKKLAILLASVTALIGALTLIEYTAQVDLGIDQLFMEHYVSTKTVFPGRMAPNTAFCFFLSGSTLLLVNLIKDSSKVLLLGPVIIGLGLMAFFGYLFGIETDYGWEHLTRMALHTSAGFILLGTSFSLLGLSKTSQKDELTHSSWPIISLSILLTILVLTLWQALSNWEDKRIKNDILNQAENFRVAAESYIDLQISTLKRMGARWEQKGGSSQDEWQADAYNYIEQLPIFQAIEWVDGSFHVRWVVPLEGNEKVIGLNIAFEEKRLESLIKARDQKIISITHTLSLIQGGKGFLAYVPLFVNNKFDGFIVGVIRIDQLFSELTQSLLFNEQLQYQIYDQGELIFSNSNSNIVNELYQSSINLSLQDINWQVKFTPTPAYLASSKSSLPILVLVSGLISIALLFYFNYLRRRDNVKTKLLEIEAQKRLAIEIEKQHLGKFNETLFNATPIAMLVINKQGKITTVNQQTLQLFGYQNDQLLGQPVDILLAASIRTQNAKDRNSYLLAPNARKIELQGQHSDNSLITLDISLTPLEDEHEGEVLASIIDITEVTENRRRLHEYTAKLEKINRELGRSNSELNDFAYVASHDLKAPLRGIMQLANWIEEDLQDTMGAETAEHLKLMQNRVSRLESLLDDLLAFSRVGQKHGDFKKINTRALVNELFELLDPPAEFTLTCDDNLPEMVTLAVPLEQVFRNLINNAIKHHHSKQGHIHISAQPAEKGYVFIVEDDGPGIPPDQHQRVFRIFQTLKPRDDIEGSGMGLAIIKKLLDNYRSIITVESDGQHGTRMIFTWPEEATLRRFLHDG